MENDQFVLVQRNGYPGKLHITTWKRIGMESNKEGWVLRPVEPSEVTDIREKKMMSQAAPNYQDAPAIVVKSEPINDENIIKVKKKPGRPKVEK